MNTNMFQIKIALQGKGIKPTYQRMLILDYLVGNTKHPTAEAIYRELMQNVPTISKTTVYNTLNLLVEKGMLVALTITGSEIRYEFKKAKHCHFYCTRCGGIFDLNLQCPVLSSEQSEIEGHVVQELHGYLKGYCSSCRDLKQNN